MAANPLVIEVATDEAGGERMAVSGHNTIAAVLSDGVQAWAVVDGTRLPLHLLPGWRQCEAFRSARIEWGAKSGGKLLVVLAQDATVQRGVLEVEGAPAAGSAPRVVQTASGLLLFDDFTAMQDGSVVGFTEPPATWPYSRLAVDAATFANTYRIKGGRLEILGMANTAYHLIRTGVDMLSGVVQVVADRALSSSYGVGAVARYATRAGSNAHAFIAYTRANGAESVFNGAITWENGNTRENGGVSGLMGGQMVTVKNVLNGALGKAGGEVVGHYFAPDGTKQNITATEAHASGAVGLQGHGEGGKFRSLAAYKGNSVRVEGLPDGAEVRIGTLRVRETGGVAVVDLGMTPCPLPKIDVVQGWAVTSSLTPIDGVWGGDVYEYRT